MTDVFIRHILRRESLLFSFKLFMQTYIMLEHVALVVDLNHWRSEE